MPATGVTVTFSPCFAVIVYAVTEGLNPAKGWPLTMNPSRTANVGVVSSAGGLNGWRTVTVRATGVVPVPFNRSTVYDTVNTRSPLEPRLLATCVSRTVFAVGSTPPTVNW